MGFIVAGLLLYIGVMAYIIRKTLVAPEVIFCLEWSGISFLAALRKYTLFKASDKTWLIILGGSLFFIIGCVFGDRLLIRQSRQNTIVNKIRFTKINIKNIFWIIWLLLLFQTIIQFFQTYRFMQLGYSLGEIREASVGVSEIEGYVRRSGGIYEYIDIFSSVIELFAVAIGIEEGISDFAHNYLMLLATLFLEVFKAFTNGGRFALAYMAVEIVVCFVIYNKTKINKAMKRVIRGILIALLIITIAITLIRGAAVEELLIKCYRYICGNVVFFDAHVQDLDKNGFMSYSFAGFYGIYAVILPILNKMGISYPQKYLDTVNIVMDGQTYRRIGTNMVTNAFITPFYHLYADFRWIGVFGGMFLFGAIAGYSYKKMKYYKTGKETANYLIISQMIFKTLHLYPFASKTYAIALIAMMF